MSIKKKINLQRFAAETNLTVTGDIEPAISMDFATRFNQNINELMEILGITNMISMKSGDQIKIYKTEVTKVGGQVGEGETIPLSKATTKLARTITIDFEKYRKATSIEAIQKRGYEGAVNKTDKALVSQLQKGYKKTFFDLLEEGTAAATGKSFQDAIAQAWGKLSDIYEDESVEAVYFVNSLDLADYLGEKNITTEMAAGFTYIKNFLGLGTVIVSPSVKQGSIKATAKENLNGAFIDVKTGEISKAFTFTTDKTGYIGMLHSTKTDNATLETLLVGGILFWVERLDGVVVSAIQTGTEAADEAGQQGA